MTLTEHITVGEKGDLAAPPGSRAWALAVRGELQAAVRDAKFAVQLATDYRNGIEKHRGYTQLVDANGQPFTSLAAFCKAPTPHGLGLSLEEFDAMLKQRLNAQQHAQLVEPLMPNGGDRHSRSFRESQVDNGNLRKLGGGNNPRYLTARIARDRPDVFERMLAGEFKSVRQAAIAAGIPASYSMTLPLQPAKVAKVLRQNFSAVQIDELIELLRAEA